MTAEIVAFERSTAIGGVTTKIAHLYRWRLKTDTSDLSGVTRTQWGARHQIRRALRIDRRTNR